MDISKDWLDFLQLLLNHKVRFVVVGGHAVGAHGLPRYTKDLDIFVDRSPENAQCVRLALVEFMGDDPSFDIKNLQDPKKITVLGTPPNRIDILTSIAGVSFEQTFDNHVLIQFDKLTLPFIGYKELIANKKAAGRPQDLADVSQLEQRQKDI